MVGDGEDYKGYDPVLISLLRKAIPQMLAFDLVGTEPIAPPTGMIFALKSRYSRYGYSDDEFREFIITLEETFSHVR